MAKNILTSPSPNTVGIASPEFDTPQFNAAVELKGYDIIVEKALRCPCNGPDAPLFNCQNCFGTGYFYINPTKIKGVITGINQDNQYKRWSEEMLGTIAVTITDANKKDVGYYDRITILKEYSYFSENLIVRNSGENQFVFTTYKPLEIYSIHLFVASNEALKLVDPSLYSVSPVNPYCIVFNENIGEQLVASVYYRHEPEYHFLDFPHEIRGSMIKNKTTGVLEKTRMPIQGIARRSHLIVSEKPNYDGSGVIINSNIKM